MQRPPRAPTSSTTTTSASDETPSKRRRIRETIPKKLATERDGGHCVFTKSWPIEVAHIYPNCLIHPSKDPSTFDKSIPEFWKLLLAFWPSNKIQSWQKEIFRDPHDPSKQVDGCFNNICFSPTIHKMWESGAFALRPLEYNNDMTELEIEWYWQPTQDHGPDDIIPLAKIPPSSRDLDHIVRRDGNIGELIHKPTPEEYARMKSGQKLVLRTSDPERLPLPSKELLEMQWHLNRIVSMSAAAEACDEDDEYNDDGGSVFVPGYRRSNVEAWVENSVHPASMPSSPASLLPPPASLAHPPSSFLAQSSSHSDSEYDSDEFHHSFTTTSTDPSPVKIRDPAVQSTEQSTEQSMSSHEQSLLLPPAN